MDLKDTDWHSRSGDIKQHAGHILATEQWTDCSFLVGSERPVELKAHKLLLALASPVFEAMFYGPIAERGDAPIRIPDVEPDTFKAMLKHIYTDHLVDDAESAVKDLYFAAQKYLLSRLMSQCITKLTLKRNYQNVSSLYEFGLMSENKEMIKKCQGILQYQCLEAFKSESFLEVQVETVAKIFSLDMEVDSEMDVIHAFTRYIRARNPDVETPHDEPTIQPEKGAGDGGKAKAPVTRSRFSTSKGTAGDSRSAPPLKSYHSNVAARKLLREIRFLTMTSDQLAEVMLELEDFLTPEEMNAILHSVKTESDSPESPGKRTVDMPEGFSTSRVPRWSLKPPKPPLPAYKLWLSSAKETIKIEHPELTKRKFLKMTKEMWEVLPDRSVWETEACILNKHYEKQKAIYERKYGIEEDEESAEAEEEDEFGEDEEEEEEEELEEESEEEFEGLDPYEDSDEYGSDDSIRVPSGMLCRYRKRRRFFL